MISCAKTNPSRGRDKFEGLWACYKLRWLLPSLVCLIIYMGRLLRAPISTGVSGKTLRTRMGFPQFYTKGKLVDTFWVDKLLNPRTLSLSRIDSQGTQWACAVRMCHLRFKASWDPVLGCVASSAWHVWHHQLQRLGSWNDARGYFSVTRSYSSLVKGGTFVGEIYSWLVISHAEDNLENKDFDSDMTVMQTWIANHPH